MNLSSFIGILAALGVLVGALISSTKSQSIFLDPHGILIVFGGTAAASLMCFPVSTFFNTAKVFVRKFLGRYNVPYEIVIGEIVDLAKGVRDNPDYIKTKAPSLRTPFLRDASQLLVQGAASEQAIDAILRKRAVTHSKRYEDDALVFKTIAKFPPAFGLMGTTLGMITLLQQLGGKDAYRMLGPSMAIGLVATFYGIAMANLVFIPIGENLSKLNKEDETIREIVMDGIKLIRAREHPLVVEDFLMSYLLPKERERIARNRRR